MMHTTYLMPLNQEANQILTLLQQEFERLLDFYLDDEHIFIGGVNICYMLAYILIGLRNFTESTRL